MALESECLKRLVSREDSGVVVFYLHFVLWLPLLVGGLAGHCALLIAVTEKFLIYMQPHYRILITSFCVNGIMHLICVAPLIFTDLFSLSSHIFSTYHICCHFLSDLFLFFQVMILSLFGYQKIVSLIHYFSGRFLIYKKHAVDIVVIVLFLSMILVCLQVLDLQFIIVCDNNGIFFPMASLKYNFIYVRFAFYVIFLFFIPLLLMITHIFSILFQRFKPNNGNLGLSNLSAVKVFIVTDQMRDNVNIVLYVMVIILVIPEIFVSHFLEYFSDEKKSARLIMLSKYWIMSFNTFAFIPFFYFMRPLRSSMVVRCSIIKKDAIHLKSKDTKESDDTLQSIGSIDLSRKEDSIEDRIELNGKETQVKFKIG